MNILSLKNLKNILTKALITLLILIPLVIGGFWLYTQTFSYSAESEYLKLALNDEGIEITKNLRYYKISPKNLNTQNTPKNTPIIYYTGGLVKPESYLFQTVQISKKLQTNIYVSRPIFNVMIFEIDLASDIIKQEKLDKVTIGGHSLGGISGCRFAKNNPQKVKLLFLFGSYCDQDLSQLDFQVLSIIGKKDGIINKENYEKSKQNLPNSAIIIEDEKLNHSNFGNYGLQKSDQESQLKVEEIVDLLAQKLQTGIN